MHYLILQSHVHHVVISHMAFVSVQQHAIYAIIKCWPRNACCTVQIHEDMIRYFPRVQASDISIRQIDSHDHILSAFDRSIAAYATDHFRRSGIDLILNCRVGTRQDCNYKRCIPAVIL